MAVNDMGSALRSRWKHDVDELVADLDRIEKRADFVAAYDRLLETAVIRPSVTYLSGLGDGGRSWFATLQTAADGSTIGCVIDLDVLAESILDTPEGSQVRAAGFATALFDAEFTSEFERRYADAVRVVVPVSSTTYRLNLGVYSRDEPFVFEHFRNRNALIIAGIAFLAGAIGLGAYVLVRETAREVQMAKLQSEFVSNVSHELRTPLTSIRMYAETLLLNRFRSEEQRREYLQTVMRESQRLSRMVGNILDFSRMESGRKTYDFEDTDLAPIVHAALEEFEPVFKERDFHLCVDIAPELPPVSIDPEAIQTVVANLLSNAVKYSLERKEVGVNLQASQGRVILEVMDRGVGIPEGEAKRVFQKYQRASNASATATGTGLGLALVAGIVESHHGAVEALPRSGGGSVLRLSLPVARRRNA
jgi:signal transduction histidine kinase